MIEPGKTEALFSLYPEMPWIIRDGVIEWPNGHGEPPAQK